MNKKWIWLCLCLARIHLATAQENTDYEIATDRPSVSFSAATTPKNILIVEVGYLQFNLENSKSKTTIIDPNISLRYGVSKRWEVRLGEEYLATRIKDKLTNTSNNSDLFLPITFGAKYRMNNPENDKWALSALWASRIPVPTHIENASLRHYGRFLGQYNLGKSYIFSNVGLDFTNDGLNKDIFLAYTLGVGRNFAEGFYAFIETFGFDSLESGFWSKGLNAGVIYIIKKRYQFDAVFGIDLENSVKNYNFFTIGFSTYFGK
jgi:hypothetical protein